MNIRSLQVGVGWFPEQAGNGLDRMFYGLTQNLPQAGVEVHGIVVGSASVSTSSEHSVWAVAAEEEHLVQRLSSFRRAAVRAFEREQIDVVAAHFALYTLPLLDRLSSRPLIMHFHGPWAAESAAEGANPLAVRTKAMLERRVYTRSDRFIVLSEAFAEVLHREYDVSEEKTRVVQGGVDVERFDTKLSREQARERLGWPLDRPIAISVRRLVRRVGLEQLVQAFHEVHRRVPDALLLIGGKGPLEAELSARIESLGLEKHVVLLGFVPENDLPLAYRAADVSVVPTQALEGFGLIAAESLAAGTPVLVTPVGGLPEVVRDLSEDLILPDHSVGALADRLIGVLEGRDQVPSSLACQQYASARFSWDRIARQVRLVYEEVL